MQAINRSAVTPAFMIALFGTGAACAGLAAWRAAADAGTAPRWRAYAREWTAWNHVRALSSVAAAGLLAVSVARGG